MKPNVVCRCGAGLVKRGEHIHVPPSEKTVVSSSLSVFSRLDGTDASPGRTYHNLPPSSSPSPSHVPQKPPQRKRTVVTAASPSPTKLSLQVTSRDGRRISSRASAPTGSSRGGGPLAATSRSKRESSSSGGGLVSSSSSFSAKEPVKSRLGNRGEHGTRYGGSEGPTHWSDAVSTSISSLGSSGRLSTRLGSSGSHREMGGASRRLRPTMVADSATNPPPKASMRLGGGTHRTTRSPSSSVAISGGARSSRNGGGRSGKPVTMKADEYELKRQLDIRSRLAVREKEVEERRSGPLRGRLGQHHVFQRLT